MVPSLFPSPASVTWAARLHGSPSSTGPKSLILCPASACPVVLRLAFNTLAWMTAHQNWKLEALQQVEECPLGSSVALCFFQASWVVWAFSRHFSFSQSSRKTSWSLSLSGRLDGLRVFWAAQLVWESLQLGAPQKTLLFTLGSTGPSEPSWFQELPKATLNCLSSVLRSFSAGWSSYTSNDGSIRLNMQYGPDKNPVLCVVCRTHSSRNL